MKRDWGSAWEKVQREGRCRVCASAEILDPAHLWHRGMGGGMSEDLILPLCRKCHTAFDAHGLDVLGYLTLSEQLALVQAAGSIESARRRALPSEYK